MTYIPVVPLSGYAGWQVLNRTMERQQAAFVASSSVQSTEEYFRSKIGGIETAEDLVNDRRLLEVALGAFGLGEDIDNKYFIRKVLSEGTLSDDSLANKLSDKTYLALSKAFGFGDYDTPRTKLSDFADTILTKYEAREFEAAVGESNETYRLALYTQRELPEIAAKSSSEVTKWYNILASEPLRSVMETAFGLPESIGALDLDQQVGIFKEKAESILGSSDPADFGTDEVLDKLVKQYILRDSIVNGLTSTSSGSVALQLLTASQSTGTTLSLLL
jgi:hypothetical protein